MSAEEHSPDAEKADGESQLPDEPKGPAVQREEDDPDDEGFDHFAGLSGNGASRYYIHAPYANLNAGSVQGDQHVENVSGAASHAGRRVEAHQGPISALEILQAQAGFAEPDWFPAAMRELDTGVLFLMGDPGTGRRTAALNLLCRHTGGSMDLRAVDSDVDLSSWRPTQTGARGYLVYGLLPKHPLGPAVIANLRRLLSDAHARMVIVLTDEPELARSLSRDLHVSPVQCEPPHPRAVFDALFESAVPSPAERDRRLTRLEPGMLDELLTPQLVPAQVAELVAAMSGSGDEGPGFTDLRDRLSFLAEGEVPDLIKKLRDDPDGLAFLLAACVFEGLDHRIVLEEAERLLVLADGRLDSVLPESGDAEGSHGPARRQDGPRPNPKFVFRRSLDDLLRMVRAQCAPKEIRTASGYTYAVEPVRLTRHGQAEAVLRHVWRQYGQLSGLLTEWMDKVPGNEYELAEPVGRVMGMAAGWGGGRRALSHISRLAGSDRGTSRAIATYALSMAAKDPILAGEVKHRLTDWSTSAGWRRRATVAYACGTGFGVSRPDLAMRLLRRAYRGLDGDEYTVARAIRLALSELFAAGSQPTIFHHIADWADRGGPDAELSLWAFPHLLREPSWFQEQLLSVGEFTEKIIDLVHRTLNDDALFDATRGTLLGWCRTAYRDDQQSTAVETLLTALAQDMRHGELRLFVEIDRADTPVLAGRHIARHALDAWRKGEPRQFSPASPHGGHDDH
ncbi:hypothetical protein [Streptomyces blattellae]|uniref:hypothetical protein n=1 Tax=Streptomyces blattellae TaxID=2569855 RepID=UPI001E4D4618|nr:hypothetical protein [Streptomyces blattellae]